MLGKRCRMELIERDEKPYVKQLKSGKLKLFVRPGASVEAKEKMLNDWYRVQLKNVIPELLNKWEKYLALEPIGSVYTGLVLK